jgi:hypothetical protein
MPAPERLCGVAARGIGVMRWLERMAATASALKGFEEFTSWVMAAGRTYFSSVMNPVASESPMFSVR